MKFSSREQSFFEIQSSPINLNSNKDISEKGLVSVDTFKFDKIKVNPLTYIEFF